MKTADYRRAENLLSRLLSDPGVEHTPELVRQVRDDELLTVADRDLLTAYAWQRQMARPYPRDSKKLLSRFVAYAEAEQDAWDLDGDAFTAKHGFPPQGLAEIRTVLIGAAVETAGALP